MDTNSLVRSQSRLKALFTSFVNKVGASDRPGTQLSKRYQTEVAPSTIQIPVAPSIELNGLTIQYGDNTVLDLVNLQVAPGAITALVGPSGCGKSSLLSVINRLCDLQGCRVSGRATIDEFDILAPSVDVMMLRRQVGMVFQRPNPFPLSIADNLRLPLREHGERDTAKQNERIERVLRKVGLWDEVRGRLDGSALTLSGGQQQRLCIARALVLEPKVILLDEPCSALDPHSTAVIERLLYSLRGQYTVLMVTHNLAQARRVADQVAVCWVQNGKGCIVESGPTEQLFSNPQNTVTASYLNGLQG